MGSCACVEAGSAREHCFLFSFVLILKLQRSFLKKQIPLAAECKMDGVNQVKNIDTNVKLSTSIEKESIYAIKLMIYQLSSKSVSIREQL